jgi:4-amino-4-deoxy-L-arabinose transferase-like glycosyltransferase
MDPFAGDWDALDYTVLALKGEPSSMILGRILFIFSNRAAFMLAHELFGLQPEKAYLLFKYMVVLESPLALVAWWVLARDLTGSKRAATAAVLLLGLSPFYVVYSGQAMTEIPSLLVLAIALILHLRGLRSNTVWMVLAGAVLMGACVNIREGAALYAPWLLFAPLVCGWRINGRTIVVTLLACALFLLCAFGPFAIWYWLDIDHYRAAWQTWAAQTKIESSRHPVSLENFRYLFRHFFFAGAMTLVAFPVAAVREYRERGWTPLLLLGLIGICANFSLIIHYSVVLNGRYLLTGLPAMAPLVGSYFVREQNEWMKSATRAFANVVGGILLVAAVFIFMAWPISTTYIKERSLSKDYIKQLQLIPKDAVIIPGSQTVAVTYWRGIGSGDWEVIGSGGSWPGPRLKSQIDEYLARGKRVFVDTDHRWWYPCGWQEMEIRELVGIEGAYHFRRVAGDLYELRPVDDVTATDSANLSKLLPENRPEESKLCRFS